MTARPRPLRRLVLLFAVAAGSAITVPAAAPAAVVGSALTVRAAGRAPVEGGHADTAYQRALNEAFRRGVLDALRGISPERQSPLDLETWQETVLSRAGDFVGAWRILSQEQKDGFLTLEVEIEIWGDKLARAALSTGALARLPAVRLVVIASSLGMDDRAADEELDAGHAAAAALEVELARRGAVIVATADGAPGERSSGASSEENRVALAAAAARRVDADAALLAQLTRRGESLVLTVELISAASEASLVTARAEVPASRTATLADAFAPAARQIAAACAPHLAATRSRNRRAEKP